MFSFRMRIFAIIVGGHCSYIFITLMVGLGFII
jgi:hypothetical protein